MTTSPYTHPSMPGTPPMVFDLSAALEDAEGLELVEAIHRRKALQQAWQYYATFHPTYDPFKATKEKLAELDEEVRGPSGLQVWVDEIQGWKDAYAPSKYSELFNEEGRLSSVSVEFQCADVSDDFMALMLGYNSAEEMRKDRQMRDHLWNQVDDMLTRPVDAPPVDVDNVRWPSDNRKLFARRDGKVSALYEILGIGDHGSDDSQVQQDARHR